MAAILAKADPLTPDSPIARLQCVFVCPPNKCGRPVAIRAAESDTTNKWLLMFVQNSLIPKRASERLVLRPSSQLAVESMTPVSQLISQMVS